MKKIVFPILFTCFVSFSYGQTTKKAESYLEKGDIDKAKTEIDGVLTKTPKDAEANYMKSKIYVKIAGDDKYKGLVQGDAREQAFEAFKKADADSNDMKTQLIIIKDNYKPIFDLYTGYFEDGAKTFNEAAAAQSVEKFTEAMNDFIKADKVGHYISTNKWAAIGEIDTTLVLNIGKAAINSKHDDIAKTYLLKLANAKISGTQGVADPTFVFPYQWLVLHYKDAGDEANMVKYANLGKEVFPHDDYADFVLIDYYRAKKDMPAVIARFKKLVDQNPDSLSYHFNFANDIFGYIYNSDEGTVIENKAELLKTLHTELDKAMALNPNDVNNNWLYAQYHYNNGIEARDSALKIRGTKPEDVKRKADVMALSMANFKEAVPYGVKAITILESDKTKDNKSKYKSITNLMQNIYQSMGDKAQLKVYGDKYDKADEIFVN
jgi:tetratricopeptide (TPR) repeat protein